MTRAQVECIRQDCGSQARTGVLLWVDDLRGLAPVPAAWRGGVRGSVWGTVVDTTTDAGGVITDPDNIGDEHLRSLALELLTEARTAGQDGALCAVRVDRDDWTGPCGEPIDRDGMCDDHARMRDEGAL